MNPFDLKQLGLDVEYPYRQQYDNYIGGKGKDLGKNGIVLSVKKVF